MVSKFGLIRTPRILFGKGQAEGLPALLKNRGGNILVITGSKSHLQCPTIGKTILTLEKEGYSLHFDKIEKEPLLLILTGLQNDTVRWKLISWLR